MESHVDGAITCLHRTVEVGNVALRMDSGAWEWVVPEVLEYGMSAYVFAVCLWLPSACGYCI
jgi:hypothetical protein